MFFTSAHIIEIIVVIIMIAASWILLKKHTNILGRLLISVIFIWYGIFGAYLSTAIIKPKEYVRITAVGEHNPLSSTNELCLIGYNANEEWHELTPPVEGVWAWFHITEEIEAFYAGWFPGTDMQPENATDSIVIEMEPGTNRTIVFLTQEWYGIAEIEMYGETYRLDTYRDSESDIKGLPLPDTNAEYYESAQLKQLPAAVSITVLLGIFTIIVLKFILYPTRKEKISKYRFLFEELVKRDFALKYKRTVFGMVWSVLSPLCTFLVMWIVFKDILGSNINNFAIYMFTGQVVFSFFSDATMQGMTSLMDNSSIFTKVNVPKYMFLLSKNISSLINFGLTLLVLMVFMLIDGIPFSAMHIMLIYPICCMILFNIGMGLILSASYVFFRDMQYLWGIFTQLLMWVSAIFYSVDGIDESIRFIFAINPIYSFIDYFRKIILEAQVPSIETHIIILAYTIVSVVIGALIYKKNNHEFLYYV